MFFVFSWYLACFKSNLGLWSVKLKGNELSMTWACDYPNETVKSSLVKKMVKMWVNRCQTLSKIGQQLHFDLKHEKLSNLPSNWDKFLHFKYSYNPMIKKVILQFLKNEILACKPRQTKYGINKLSKRLLAKPLLIICLHNLFIFAHFSNFSRSSSSLGS